ncbi:hypothetical protein BaRGS_00009236 [Batillaria attramentaria]|uniref:Uncharacterized protein n=1 Tax=Batillaria attramentaria TaxID=370345 RepID=A0ABD0LKV6_9CAEN
MWVTCPGMWRCDWRSGRGHRLGQQRDRNKSVTASGMMAGASSKLEKTAEDARSLISTSRSVWATGACSMALASPHGPRAAGSIASPSLHPPLAPSSTSPATSLP